MDRVAQLEQILTDKDNELKLLKEKLKSYESAHCLDLNAGKQHGSNTTNLDLKEIERYGRQMILPELGMEGQKLLQSASVLIVGAGGLGCPAAIYLAAAGVGHLGVVDYDDIELGNLHRQVLHTESRLGTSKCKSIAEACCNLNSKVTYTPHHVALNSSNAMEIIKKYHIVVDATDNVATRYLLNDACILAEKPLVSGSALRFEGQLTVYNYKGGPCYRCLYPVPPPPETVTNCSDGGVLGAVPGVIGCLQAIEVVKIITSMENTMSQKLLLFDALDGSFRRIKLRAKQPTCCVCGDKPSITKLIDYEQFCGAKAADKGVSIDILPEQDRITVNDYEDIVKKNKPHLLIDVRPPVQTGICQLPNTINIPLDKIVSPNSIDTVIDTIKLAFNEKNSENKVPIYVVCRQGNDSQIAAKKLQNALHESNISIKDIKGGLTAWSKKIDNSFPRY